MSHAPAVRRARTGRPAPCVAEVFEPRVLLAVFTVTTTDDAGPGSLRQAITSANSAAGGDVIEFNIPGGGQKIIRPASPLPDVSDPVDINGRSQPGAASGDILIELDGSAAGGSTSGLFITVGATTLTDAGNGGSGIYVDGSPNNVINATPWGNSRYMALSGNGRYGV